MRYSIVIISALAATAFASQVSQDAATDNASPRFAVAAAEGSDDLESMWSSRKGGSSSSDSIDDIFDNGDDSDLEDDSVLRGAAGVSFRASGLTVSTVALAAAIYAGIA